MTYKTPKEFRIYLQANMGLLENGEIDALIADRDAAMQARIEEARAHLGAAVVQMLPTDDQIIRQHVYAAQIALAGKGQS